LRLHTEQHVSYLKSSTETETKHSRRKRTTIRIPTSLTLIKTIKTNLRINVL